MTMELPKLNLFTHGNGQLLKTLNDKQSNYDGLVVIYTDKEAVCSLVPAARSHFELDASFGDSLQHVFPESKQPNARVLLAPTGSLYNDFDDARRFKDIAFAAGKKALKMGMTSPLVCFADEPCQQTCSQWTHNEDLKEYQHFLEVTMLGLLESCFEPIDVRQHMSSIKTFQNLGFVVSSENASSDVVSRVSAIEAGRRVCKDIGNPDPEKMSPINIAKYIEEQFKNVDNIKVTVISDIDEIKKNYPLAHAVTRASLAVERHHPRFVHFEYKSPEQSKVKENLYFVGKGVTYDTGGADIKCSGHMRDMSRDKCGAAAVAGFFKTISMLSPKNVNVTGALALVRNSVGPDMYVSDEVIVARSGKRVLVGNTDAEGRMVMTDLLCEFKERAMAAAKNGDERPSFLFTCATLTGHAIRAYGGYGISLDNGVARRHKISKRIHDAGHIMADPFETSTMRREDLTCVHAGSSNEDLVSANDKASSMTDRGHQYPAGFMLQAAGLEKHGLDAKDVAIGYTHVDIAGSAETISAEGWSLPRVTGSPIVALTAAFLL